MIRTVDAVIDQEGNLQLVEPVQSQAKRLALVTILKEKPGIGFSETTLLSESALAEYWNRSEEDEAWLQTQPERSFSCGFRSPTSQP